MVTMKKSVTMEAVKSLLLEWDGDGSGLEAVETAGGTLYKVADVIIQNEDIPGMTVTDNEGKETLVTDSVYNDMISRSLVGEGFAAKVAGLVWIAQKEAQAPGAKLPGGGIWLLKKQDGSYPKKVVLPAYREAFLQGEKPDGEQGESMNGIVNSVNGVKPDGAGNVALKYDDLEDRPFGEETVKGETIEWDGNTEGLAKSDYSRLFKVSDKVLTVEEIVGGTIEVTINGEKKCLAISDSFDRTKAVIYSDEEIAGCFFIDVYDTDGYNYTAATIVYAFGDTGEYPENGVYFADHEGRNDIPGQVAVRTTALMLPETTTIKRIDPKLLPVTPFFDLAEMGLPATEIGGGVQQLDIDTSEMISAMQIGAVRVKMKIDSGMGVVLDTDFTVQAFHVADNAIIGETYCLASIMVIANAPYLVSLQISSTRVESLVKQLSYL